MPDDLDTTNPCEAHRAVQLCLKGIKQTQTERTTHLEEMHKDINTKVGLRLFIAVMLILVGFMSYNALQNFSVGRDVAVMAERMKNLSVRQNEIKGMIENLN